MEPGQENWPLSPWGRSKQADVLTHRGELSAEDGVTGTFLMRSMLFSPAGPTEPYPRPAE